MFVKQKWRQAHSFYIRLLLKDIIIILIMILTMDYFILSFVLFSKQSGDEWVLISNISKNNFMNLLQNAIMRCLIPSSHLLSLQP
jgi:fumarate reductase subunit C